MASEVLASLCPRGRERSIGLHKPCNLGGRHSRDRSICQPNPYLLGFPSGKKSIWLHNPAIGVPKVGRSI